MIVMRIAILYVPTVDDVIGIQLLSTLQEYVPQVLGTLSAAIPDQRNLVAETMRRWCDEESIELLLTVGGISIAAGTTGHESVPLAMMDVEEREVPGLAEAMRAYAQEDNPYALLENARVGIRGRTLIVNLPRDRELAQSFLEAIVDLIEPLIHRLQGSPDFESSDTAMSLQADETQPAMVDGSEYGHVELNAEEFAAFLAHRHTETS